MKGRGLNGELASNLDSLQRQVGEGGVVRELGKRLASSLHRHQPHVTSIPSSTSIIFSSLVFSPHAHPGGGGVNPLSGLATREAELGSWNGVGVEGVVGGLLLSNQPNSLNALSSLTVTPFNMGKWDGFNYAVGYSHATPTPGWLLRLIHYFDLCVV